MNELKIVEQPKSGYVVVRQRPVVILSCRALNARIIRFKCNSKWIDQSRHRTQQGIDAITQLPFFESNIEIARTDFDSDSTYICQCYAFASSSSITNKSMNQTSEIEQLDTQISQDPSTTVRSDPATVRLAYMKRHFNQIPLSERVHEGRTIQLMCSPPDSEPKAEIFWHKDGREILMAPASTSDMDVNTKVYEDSDEDDDTDERFSESSSPGVKSTISDGNLIIASDGSLIISSTRISDSGNYTCEARNIANRRFTDPAQIIVYVDGGWSPWSLWEGNCQLAEDCIVLTSQLAMNRGDSNAIQRVLRSQRRTRACNNPSPINGGSFCRTNANVVAIEDEEFKLCEHHCKIDGSWGQWGSWSLDCDSKCQRHRSRNCDAPAPANSGTFCQGPSTQWKNCTSEFQHMNHLIPYQQQYSVPSHCLPKTFPSSHFAEKVPSDKPFTVKPGQFFETHTFMIASFGCFAFFLLVIALLIALLFYKQRRKNNESHYSGIFLGPDGKQTLYVGEEELDKNHFFLFADQNGTLLHSGAHPFIHRHSDIGSKRSYPATPSQLSKFYPVKGHSMKDVLVSSAASGTYTPKTAAYLVSPNSYTLRSVKSNNGIESGKYSIDKRKTATKFRKLEFHPFMGTIEGTEHSADSQAALIAYTSPSSTSSSNNNSATGSIKSKLAFQNEHSLHPNPGTASCSFGNITETTETVADENYATLYDYITCGRGSSQNMIFDMEPNHFKEGTEETSCESIGIVQRTCLMPPSIDLLVNPRMNKGPSIIAAEVNSERSKIELQKIGASLLIGEGAFIGTPMVYLSVSDYPNERPQINEGETWLSNLISFGLCDAEPPINLERPVTLSFDHFASLSSGKENWRFSLYYSKIDSDPLNGNSWKKVCETKTGIFTGRGSKNFPRIFVHVGTRRCLVMAGQFGRFLLAGKPRNTKTDVYKRVKIGLYWTPQNSNFLNSNVVYDSVPLTANSNFQHVNSSQVRIYCVPDTSASTENVRQQEKILHEGIQLTESRIIRLKESGSICCLFESFHSNSYSEQPKSQHYLEISDQQHQWCSQNGIHFSIPIEPQRPNAIARVTIFQKENYSHQQIFEFSLDRNQENSKPINGLIRNTPTSTKLSAAFRTQLSSLLDYGENGRDWRELILKFGLGSDFQVFIAQWKSHSPTSLLLDFWNALSESDERSVRDLPRILREMSYHDSATDIEYCLTSSH